MGSRSSSNGCVPAGLGRQLEGPAVQILPFAGCPVLAAWAFAGRQAVEQSAALFHALGPDGGNQLFGSMERRHGGMIGCRADEQRAVLHAEVSAGADVRAQKTGSPTHLISQTYEAMLRCVGSNLGQDRADVRRVCRRLGLAAQAVVHGVEMIADVSDVRHRADQAELPGQRGQARIQLGETHAGNGRGDGLVGAANFRRAPGFRSQVSRWLGPPHSKMKMQDFSAAPRPSPRSRSTAAATVPGRPAPRALIAPACNSLRRDSRMVRAGFSPGEVLIAGSSVRDGWFETRSNATNVRPWAHFRSRTTDCQSPRRFLVPRAVRRLVEGTAAAPTKFHSFAGYRYSEASEASPNVTRATDLRRVPGVDFPEKGRYCALSDGETHRLASPASTA